MLKNVAVGLPIDSPVFGDNLSNAKYHVPRSDGRDFQSYSSAIQAPLLLETMYVLHCLVAASL